MKNNNSAFINLNRYIKDIVISSFIEPDDLDNEVKICGATQSFTFNDILDFYAALTCFSNYYYTAEKVFWNKYQKHSIASIIRINKTQLTISIKAFLLYCLKKDLDKKVIESLIDFHTYGRYNVFDLCCHPLVYVNGDYIIIPSIVTHTNYGRIFIEHIGKLNIRLKKGSLFEKYFVKMLKEHDFNIYENDTKLNFTTKEKHKGDIDVLALKDNFLFCFQLKNRPNPLEMQEYKNFDRKLVKAIDQLRYVEEYISENPQVICDFYNTSDLSKFKVIKVTISMSFYRSGECIDNVHIMDMSAFHVLFDKGKIHLKNGDGVPLRKGERVSSKELIEFMRNPYFLWKGVYFD